MVRSYSNILILHFLQFFCTVFLLTILTPWNIDDSLNSCYWSVMHKIQRKSTKIIEFSKKKNVKNWKYKKKFCQKKLHFASLEDVGKNQSKTFQSPLHAHFFAHFFMQNLGLLLTQKEKSSRDMSVTKKSCIHYLLTNPIL